MRSTREKWPRQRRWRKDGLRLSSLDPQGALVLGQVYERWASGPVGPGRRFALARQARQSLEAARAFKPVEEYALVDLAAVDGIFLADPIDETEALKQANALVPDGEAGGWFDAYVQASSLARNPDLGRFYARRAFWFFDRAVDSAKRNRQPTFSLLLRSGVFHYRLGELRPAQADLQAAANEDHDPDVWKAESLLAATLRGLGDPQSAVVHMERAIEGAPEPVRSNLKTALAQMRAQFPGR